MKKNGMPSAQPLTEAVKNKILDRILSGELKAGDRLMPERELSEKLGVSRSSLHQAILALSSQGFVSIVPRRGTVVNDFRKHPTAESLAALMKSGSVELDYSLFRDMMDTRLWLESECARRACTNIYPETLREMRSMVEQMTYDNPNLTELIYEFHYTLTQASGNSLYSMIFRGFESVISSLIRLHYSEKPEDLSDGVRLRRELLDAIEANRPDLAAELTCRAITQGIDMLEKRYG